MEWGDNLGYLSFYGSDNQLGAAVDAYRYSNQAEIYAAQNLTFAQLQARCATGKSYFVHA